MTEKDLPSRLIGYARVSTYGQTLDAQLGQLKAAGCARIFREKVTGARADRKELLKMLKQLAPGDVVTVTRIDRLARSTFDLFAIVKQIADAGARFKSLAEPWADTGTSTGRLMLAVLGGLADVERDLIRTRTAEGRSRATARGQHMGRPPALTLQQQTEARQRRAEGATLKELARSYNVSSATISRLGAVLATLLICLPMFAAAQPNDGADVISLGAKTFMDQYWSKVSAPNAIALPYLDSAVADQINFYGQSMSRAKYLKTETAFLYRWPDRRYSVQPGSETIKCDEGQSTCELTGDMSLVASSPDRGVATKAGEEFDFTLKYDTTYGKTIFHIVKITGVVGGIGQVTDLTTGSVPYISSKLLDVQVQAIGCLDSSSSLGKNVEVHRNCSAVAAVDLTAAYHTSAKWQFVITQESPAYNTGDLQFIFLKNGAPVRISADTAKFAGEYSSTQQCANSMASVSLVYPTKNARWPLIVVGAACFTGGPNQPEFLGVWAYNPTPQQFDMIWGSVTQCGEDARLFTSGSLAGYFVSDTDPPRNPNGQIPPYSDINVYRLMPDQHLNNVLHYRKFFRPLPPSEEAAQFDTCGYFDPFSGVDSDLSTIFARLGLSQH